MCSVHECLKIWQASWKWGPSTSFLLFIRREWQFASGKIHFQILFMWQEINQGTCKCKTHILLFTATSYEHKHVSDLLMLVFCFHGHTFVVYLWTTKVHNDSVFKELTLHFLLQKFNLWNPPHAFGFPILHVNTPHALRIPRSWTPPPLRKS